MPLQNAVTTTVASKIEATWGTKPTASGAQYVRRVQSSLTLGKDTYSSNEARSDLLTTDMRHGTRRPQGSIDGELSTATYDPWIEAVLRGTWAVGATFSASGGNEITTTATTIVRAGAGSWITDGFRVGDVVRMTNHSTVGNNGRNLRIASLTATVLTIAGTAPLTLDAAPDATCTVAVVGNKLTNGLVKRSFTLEQNYPDADLSELFTGWRFGSMGVSIPANGMATCSFGGLGRDVEVVSAGSAPYYTTPTAETTTGLLAGVSGMLRIGGADVAVITSADIAVDLALEAPAVAGSVYVPEIFYGRTQISGNITCLFDETAGLSLLNGFIAETEFELAMLLEGPTQPADFMQFYLPRIKLTGNSKTIGSTGGIPITFPFMALRRSGTGYDTTAMTVQRSN